MVMRECDERERSRGQLGNEMERNGHCEVGEEVSVVLM